MSDAAEGEIRDPRCPLLFDTNAIWPLRADKSLRKIRAAFPTRRLLVPVVVVAERARQLLTKFGVGFEWEQITGFLGDPGLGLEVLAFDRDTVVPVREPLAAPMDSPWLQVVGHFDEAEWGATEGARFADHAVYAMARQTGAILVTNDGPLRRQAQRDAYRPGTVPMDALLRACG